MRISDWSSDVCSSDLLDCWLGGRDALSNAHGHLVTKVKEIAIRQVAALPYQIDAAGHARVMLITSRESRRWVVPKGNPVKGIALHEAAAHEAFEEAGVTGIPCPTALGEYRYAKRRRDGTRSEEH